MAASRRATGVGRWLQIILVVAFVLEVGNAVITFGAAERGVEDRRQVLFGVVSPHLPGIQRLLMLTASAVLFWLWQARTREWLARSLAPQAARRAEVLPFSSLVSRVTFGPYLDALELELSPAVLFAAWRICVAGAAAAALFFLSCLLVPHSSSLIGYRLELWSSIALSGAMLATFLVVDFHQRLEAFIAGGRLTQLQQAVLPSQSVPPVPGPAAPAPAVAPLAARGDTAVSGPVPGPALPAGQCPDCGGATENGSCPGCGAISQVKGYVIEKLLAKRAYGRTYLARSSAGERVVIKEIRFAHVPDARTLEAFDKEARLLGQLRHSRIPRLVDHFRTGEGALMRLYLAHEYLEGQPLNLEVQWQPLDAARVVQVVRQCLQILVYLHRQTPKIIHRDIKPSNLIRMANGSVGLVDFGAARELASQSLEGTLAGTVGYMPPEQLAGHVDETSDLYALGVTAIHLLTGIAPAAMLGSDARLHLPSLPAPRAFERYLLRLAAPTRKARFATAVEALRELEREAPGFHSKPGRASEAAGFIAAAALLGSLALCVQGGEAPAPGAGERPAETAPEPQASGNAESQATPPPSDGPGVLDRVADPEGDAVVVSWSLGSVTRRELEAELRELPPGLKFDSDYFIQSLAYALAARKALAKEARGRGIVAASGPFEERRLVRSLVAQELGPKPRNHEEALGHHERFIELVNLSLRGTVALEEGELKKIKVDPTAPVIAPAKSEFSGPAEGFFLAQRDGYKCDGIIYPDHHWYQGACEGDDPDLLTLLDLDVLYLEATYGPVEGFLHRFAFDARERVIVISSVHTSRSADAMPPDFEEMCDRYSLRLERVTAVGVSDQQARDELEKVVHPLRHCLAYYYWINQYPETEGPLSLTVKWSAGRVQSFDVNQIGFTPFGRIPEDIRPTSFDPAICGEVFRTYAMEGSGEVEYRFKVQVQ